MLQSQYIKNQSFLESVYYIGSCLSLHTNLCMFWLLILNLNMRLSSMLIQLLHTEKITTGKIPLDMHNADWQRSCR